MQLSLAQIGQTCEEKRKKISDDGVDDTWMGNTINCRYSLLTLALEVICHLIYPFRWQVDQILQQYNFTYMFKGAHCEAHVTHPIQRRHRVTHATYPVQRCPPCNTGVFKEFKVVWNIQEL
ncbi:hypothetical protein SADUNF_Sadunf15G0043400 [Salix dunnii]|uniref:Uncharacterized protein n=1 Tax=Salix dunnii TaxID=1413687 RepID=A0A835MS54_9ROSI|nr:hypothetical protein SADUNF_Sadunf15G0043400 [Salix dunnii]